MILGNTAEATEPHCNSELLKNPHENQRQCTARSKPCSCPLGRPGRVSPCLEAQAWLKASAAAAWDGCRSLFPDPPGPHRPAPVPAKCTRHPAAQHEQKRAGFGTAAAGGGSLGRACLSVPLAGDSSPSSLFLCAKLRCPTSPLPGDFGSAGPCAGHYFPGMAPAPGRQLQAVPTAPGVRRGCQHGAGTLACHQHGAETGSPSYKYNSSTARR